MPRWLPFLTLFLSTYLLMHLTVWAAIKPLRSKLRLSHPALATIALFFFAPLLSRLFEHHNLETLAQLFAWGGYLWMGVLFISFSYLTPLLFWNLSLHYTSGYLRQNATAGTRTCSIVLILIALLSGYALFSGDRITVRRIDLETPKLPPKVPELRIVQISDLHLGLRLREEKLQQVVDLIQPLAPDLIVVTGDLLDGDVGDPTLLYALFSQLEPPMGKYAISGNHEVYVGQKEAEEFFQKSGLQLLDGRWDDPGPLLIAGLADPASGALPSQEIFPNGSEERFRLLLKHRPTETPQALSDLQLSGHTHGGQIAPFNLMTSLAHPYPPGLVRLSNGWLYTSRGTGTWGPPMRLFSPAEITLIRLQRPQ
ncbi:MAG: metallophosphoesterase [Desulfuromonas sp.]|nr:MAG: metallophosphoesterase [Desulfuromonas sp.]